MNCLQNLSAIDNEFVEKIEKDVKRNLLLLTTQENRVALVFPPLNNFRRFLIHTIVQEVFSDYQLRTLSVGKLDGRRTVVYSSRYDVTENLIPCKRTMTAMERSKSPHSAKCKLKFPSIQIYRPPAARKDEECTSNSGSTSRTDKSTRNRKPDKQVYIPRAKRILLEKSIEISDVEEKTFSTEIDNQVGDSAFVHRISLNGDHQEYVKISSLHKEEGDAEICFNININDNKKNDNRHIEDYERSERLAGDSSDSRLKLDVTELVNKLSDTVGSKCDTVLNEISCSITTSGNNREKLAGRTKKIILNRSKFRKCLESKQSVESRARRLDCTKQQRLRSRKQPLKSDTNSNSNYKSQINREQDDIMTENDNVDDEPYCDSSLQSEQGNLYTVTEDKICNNHDVKVDFGDNNNNKNNNNNNNNNNNSNNNNNNNNNNNQIKSNSNNNNCSSNSCDEVKMPKQDQPSPVKDTELCSDKSLVEKDVDLKTDSDQIRADYDTTDDFRLKMEEDRNTVNKNIADCGLGDNVEIQQTELITVPGKDANGKQGTEYDQYDIDLNLSSADNEASNDNGSNNTIGDSNADSSESAKEESSERSSGKISIDRCDWDELFDENGEYVNADVMDELMSAIGKVSVKRASCDYREFQTVEERTSDGECIVEIYGFPAEFKTSDLMIVFADFQKDGIQIVWVDDTHALGIFPSPSIADRVLNTEFSFAKTRPLKQAISKSKFKAKDFILPTAVRPQTCVVLARRLVSGALGMKINVPENQRKVERKLLSEAKERKMHDLKQKNDIWKGTTD